MRQTRHGLALLCALAAIAAACTPQGATPSPSPSSPAAAVTPVRAVRGGTLTIVTSEQPATYDAHREASAAVLDLLAPEYSLLYKSDPRDPARLVPDVAADQPQLSSDKLTVTVKLRTDVKFHDGAALTSADVVATYQKILAGSPRASWYAMIDAVSAPDPATVTFKLKAVTAGFPQLLASPWNVLYSAAKLRQDPRWYETNVDGTGPFVFVSNEKGESWSAKRNAAYFAKDAAGTQLPYLDGFTALIRPDPAARVEALTTKKAAIDPRGVSTTERDAIARAIGADLSLQEVTAGCVDLVIPNVTKKPFDDASVRQALSLAIDRKGNNSTIAAKANLRDVGGVTRPHGAFAMGDADLQKVKGFGADASAARDQAKKALAAAGVANLRFTLVTPPGDAPYGAEVDFLIDQWKQAGITVTRQTSQTTGGLLLGPYDVALVTRCAPLDDADVVLAPLRGSFGDAKLDGMIDAQSHETDVNKRLAAVTALQTYLMDEKAYAFPVLWWYRSVPYLRTVHGWTIAPGDGNGLDLASVWASAS